MTTEQHALLSLLSKALFDRSATLPASLDRRLLAREAAAHAVFALAFSQPDTAFADAEDQQQTMEIVSNNVLIFYHHELLHQWMKAKEIPYVVLKGCASAAYYPDPLLRSMGDVDFLVPVSRMEEAGRVLEAHGLVPWEKEHISHVVYRSEEMHFEMHFRPAGMPEGKAGKLAEAYLSDVFETAQTKPVGESTMTLPSPFHHGLVLLLHATHHMTGEGIGLRHLCDWAVFENGFSDEAFCEIFEEKLKAIGLWQFARVLTQIAVKYLGAQRRSWVGDADDVADFLMEDILSSGNFGVKDADRDQEMLFISDRGKDGVGRTGMRTQFVRSVNKIVYDKFPAAGKNKLLLVWGWIVCGTRYSVRVLLGKRKNLLGRDILQGASQRRELYQQLKLFETE